MQKVAINTVDAFQAQEKQCIILSCVRSGNKRKKNGQLGFLTDQRRVNVALSRAKDALLIVGNLTYLSKYSTFWQRLLAYYPSVSNVDAMDALARCQRLLKDCSCCQCALYQGTPGQLDKMLGKVPSLVFPNVRKGGCGPALSHDNESAQQEFVEVPISERQDQAILAKKFSKFPNGVKNVNLYKALEKHVLKYPQLKHCGYPLIFRKKSSMYFSRK